LINIFLRKLQTVAKDPVLRKWLIGRLLGNYPAEPAYQIHQPPYLKGMLPLTSEIPSSDLLEIAAIAPETSIDLPLAGQTIALQPGHESELFQRSFDDTETLMSLHRFAWLAALEYDADPAWVSTIWSAWKAVHGMVDESWAWHPYTASERAINILTFATRHGLPGPIGDTLPTLAAHGPAIASKLEYFGDHHTSNHLANNGRGLFLLGLVLGMPDCADLGAKILTEEAKRIFKPSGMLREGSSHYHLLLARNYRIAMNKAEEYEHPAFSKLSKIVQNIYSPLPYLRLPNGLPLIGDISPDLSPARLVGEFYIDTGAETCDPATFIDDGWLRFDVGPWAGLWHASPDGWSHMPGHGHQDCGSFEIHYDDTPIFVDPGRGSYGEEGDAALYRSAAVHNSIIIDGADPYPANKPYYDDSFRRQIAGAPPILKRSSDGVSLTYYGFSRLKSVGPCNRVWSFDGDVMSVLDNLEGSGNHAITRSLCTTLPVEQKCDSLILNENGMSFRLQFNDGNFELENGTRWTAYGEGQPATFIHIKGQYKLPWRGSFTLEKISL
jgi:hypothetical protein